MFWNIYLIITHRVLAKPNETCKVILFINVAAEQRERTDKDNDKDDDDEGRLKEKSKGKLLF